MIADEYDVTIRRLVPHYEQMLTTVIQWLDGHVPPRGLVVDLGAGTGGLSAAIVPAGRVDTAAVPDAAPGAFSAPALAC